MKNKTVFWFLIILFVIALIFFFDILFSPEEIGNLEANTLFSDSGMQTFLEAEGIKGIEGVSGFNFQRRHGLNKDEVVLEGKFGLDVHTFSDDSRGYRISIIWDINLTLNEFTYVKFTAIDLKTSKKVIQEEYTQISEGRGDKDAGIILNITRYIFNDLVKKNHISGVKNLIGGKE